LSSKKHTMQGVVLFKPKPEPVGLRGLRLQSYFAIPRIIPKDR
jgi:hypothetical protein